MTLYRGMDRPTLDAAYNNGKAVVNWPAIKTDWEARSAELRTKKSGRLDIPYGPGPRQRLDWFAGQHTGRPVLVFVHGGYWQWNDKETFTFIAEGALAHGLGMALIEYTLAPAARIGAIIDEIGLALGRLEALIAEAGGAPAKLVLIGHSAGGHLIEHHRDRPSVVAAMPISGIFDLEPISLNFLNDLLQLSPAEVAAFSPLYHVARGAPLILTVGGAELPELRRQTAEFAVAARAAEEQVTVIPAPGRDHFTILEELAAPNGRLLAAILDRGL